MLPGLILVAVLARPTPAETLISRGSALVARGDFDAARRAADAADQAQQPAAAEEIRGSIAEASESLGRAAGHYTRALQFAERENSSPLMAAAAESLARAFGQQGRIELTLALANRMMDRDPANRALYLFERGVALSSLNEPDAAGEAFHDALSLAEAAGNLKLTAQIHRHLGLLAWRFERDQTLAFREYDEALAYAQRAQTPRIAVLTLINYGNILRSRQAKRFPEALQRYEQGMAIARRDHLRDEIAYLLKNEGETYRQQHDRAHAEPLLTGAMELADKANVEEVRWMARDNLGLLLRDQDPVRAERNFREALDIIESYQSDVSLDDFRPGELAGEVRFANPYDDFIDFLVEHGRDRDAFYVAERQRARAFLETLSRSRETIAATVPAGFRESEREILDRIRTAQASLRSDALSDSARAARITDVERDEAALSNLRLRLATENPPLAHARFPTLWKAADVQSKLLHSDETLFTLSLGANRSVAWVITRRSFQRIELAPANEIDRLVTPALEQLRNPLARDAAALTSLSKVLSIDRVARLAKGTHLIIVPCGSLYYVPFEALPDADGHRLVERFAVSYVPSVSSLAFLRSSPPRQTAGKTFVAVANPIVAGRFPALTRQFDLAHVNQLAPLPSTADEVHAVASLFGDSVSVLEGPQATRSQLRIGGLQQARILHFATHGLIDEVHPERSGLLLTADLPRDDGLLQARDIYPLRLNADLVTLSACETALGKNVSGEGMIGLTRAFFFAGARSVVASLWDVDDASTSRLMQRFYTNVRRGEPVDVALQHAKLDFLHAGGAKSAPFFWASFIVSGQARSPIAMPPSSQPLRLAAALAIVLVAVVWYYLRIVNERRGDAVNGRP